jgi:hypothetical protein
LVLFFSSSPSYLSFQCTMAKSNNCWWSPTILCTKNSGVAQLSNSGRQLCLPLYHQCFLCWAIMADFYESTVICCLHPFANLAGIGCLLPMSSQFQWDEQWQHISSTPREPLTRVPLLLSRHDSWHPLDYFNIKFLNQFVDF